MSARQCPRCDCPYDSMTEVAGDLHCLACGYVADVPMEAWDECEVQKDARVAELEMENERLLGSVEILQEALKNQGEELLRSDKALEDAAGALEVCDVTLAERDRMLRHVVCGDCDPSIDRSGCEECWIEWLERMRADLRARAEEWSTK